MWIWIGIVGMIFLIFIWGIVAGAREDDIDYESQLRAIEEWNKEHEIKNMERNDL